MKRTFHADGQPVQVEGLKMPRKLRDESTPEGKAIWADVDKAASRTYRALSEEVLRLREDRDALRLEVAKIAGEHADLIDAHRAAINDRDALREDNASLRAAVEDLLPLAECYVRDNKSHADRLPTARAALAAGGKE